ncbi:MAG: hypothetical protein H0U70_08660 [Tatlockia sp.]|nr:hypothetical protein [Tatlockia sp.]
MKELRKDDLKIFKEEQKLHTKWRDLQRDWLEEVKKSHDGEVSYHDTEHKHGQYLTAYHDWEKFHQENVHILLAKST